MKKNYKDVNSFNFYYGMPKCIVRESLEKDGYDVSEGKDFLKIDGRFKKELKKKIETFTSVKFEIEKDSVSEIKGEENERS